MNMPLKLAIVEKFRYQKDFAVWLNIHPVTLSRIINGQFVPNNNLKQRIADALEKRVEEMFSPESVKGGIR